MKNGISLFGLICLGSILMLMASCTYNHVPESNKKLILIWHPAPAHQSKDEFITGLTWMFSYLGAKLPASDFDRAIVFVSATKIEIDIDALGFADFAQTYIQKLISLLKQSQEYQQTGGIDAGRFFALCFNNTYHYYKITGAPATLNEFSAQYANFAHKTFVCDTSSISNYSRIFKYSIADLTLQKNYFISEEGIGRYSSGDFEKTGIIEAFDYMENGQPRFVIYNEQGNLYVPSNASQHPAGKPAKCMWCHESRMQPLFNQTGDINGFVSVNEFKSDHEAFIQRLQRFHELQKAKINFNDKKAHTQGEYIYLAYYLPTIERLADEWNMSLDAVSALLKDVPKHDDPEFPFLKDVYYRYQVNQYAPFSSIEVSKEMREASPDEPNFLK